jgi:hypothetical protein
MCGGRTLDDSQTYQGSLAQWYRTTYAFSNDSQCSTVGCKTVMHVLKFFSPLVYTYVWKGTFPELMGHRGLTHTHLFITLGHEFHSKDRHFK